MSILTEYIEAINNLPNKGRRHQLSAYLFDVAALHRQLRTCSKKEKKRKRASAVNCCRVTKSSVLK